MQPARPPILQSALDPAGPYLDVTNATLDIEARTIAIPLPSSARFYRLSAVSQLSITGLSVSGEQLLLSY